MNSTPWITRASDGSYRLAVHATPGARRDQVGGEHDGALKVAVTAAADQGRANQAILQQLAKSLDLKPRQIQLQSGAGHRRKVFRIVDASDEIVERVAQAARGA